MSLLGDPFKTLLVEGAGMATARQRHVFYSLGTFLAWLIFGAGKSVLAQDLGEVEAEVQPLVVQRFVLTEANFNQWVFRNISSNRSPQDRLKWHLMMYVAEVERSCPISEAQKQKLILAGSGDIKRFNDRLADARSVFERYKEDRNNINEIMQETQPLASSLETGLFGEGSFYAKSLSNTLSPEQAARYRKGVIEERKRFRYEAKVSLAVANLDAAVGFTAEQNRRFLALILAETTPPEQPAGQFEANVVLFKIAQLPETKIRPIFNDAQWKTLNQQLQQALGLEPMLRANGALDSIEPTKAAKPAAKND